MPRRLENTNNGTVGVIVISVGTGVVLMGLLSLVAKFVFTEKQQNKCEWCTKRFSTPCKYLTMNPDDDYETFERHSHLWTYSVNEEGEYVCTTKNLTKIMEKMAEKTARLRLSTGLTERRYLCCGNRSLARQSGDLTVTFNRIFPHQNFSDAGQIKLHWDKHTEHSFVDPRFLYHNGELTIPETRIYTLYASVIFRVNMTQTRRISLRICRKVYNYENTLLGETKLISTGKGNIHTSLHVGGHFLLNK